MSFENKTVVITGGASGIGKGVAIAYAKAGSRVFLADIDGEKVEETAKAIRLHGGQATAVTTDVRESCDIEALFEKVENESHGVDILINNAGVSRFKALDELTIEEYDDVLAINLRGYFICAKLASAMMKRLGIRGSIVNMASTRAVMSEPGSEAYASSKGGIVGLTHALAISLSEARITVNAISPGWIETGNYEKLREVDHHQHPSQRVGKPEDIARACLYLTEEQNDFVTGINLMVDGGMTRKMIYEH